ncbi:MAG: TfoX/Sxy family protein [Lysobacteraceae bacterium]
MSVKLQNIGPKSAAWLRQVGIRSQEDLVAAGSVEAFLRCKRAGFRPSLNMLYALEGALLGCHWQKIPEERRATLQVQVEEGVAKIPVSRGRAAALAVSEVRDVSMDDAGSGMEHSFGFDDPSVDSSRESE